MFASLSSSLRQVVQDREVLTEMRAKGKILIYTRESYKTHHSGRDPVTDDGLKLTEITAPDGRKLHGVKVLWL